MSLVVQFFKNTVHSVPAKETAKHPAKFCWPPLRDVGAVTKPRHEIRWNLLGCPKLANGSQPLVGRSSPYCGGHVKEVLLFNSLFPIVDICLSCEDIAGQSCAMVPRWRFFVSCIFQRAACSTFQTCILNLHKGHIMCESMVYIQSPTAEIRRRKKEKEKKKKEEKAQDENMMSASDT